MTNWVSVRLVYIGLQPEPTRKLMYHFLEACLAKGQLQQTRGWLHLPEHKIQFSEDEQALWQAVLEQFEQQHGHPFGCVISPMC